MKNEDWRQQQLICIDVDNDNDKIITPEEAVNLLEKVNIHTISIALNNLNIKSASFPTYIDPIRTQRLSSSL